MLQQLQLKEHYVIFVKAHENKVHADKKGET